MKQVKRILAILILIGWGVLLAATLYCAIVDTVQTRELFPGLLFTDILLPVVAYAMLLIYKYLRGRNEPPKQD